MGNKTFLWRWSYQQLYKMNCGVVETARWDSLCRGYFKDCFSQLECPKAKKRGLVPEVFALDNVIDYSYLLTSMLYR